MRKPWELKEKGHFSVMEKVLSLWEEEQKLKMSLSTVKQQLVVINCYMEGGKMMQEMLD